MLWPRIQAGRGDKHDGEIAAPSWPPWNGGLIDRLLYDVGICVLGPDRYRLTHETA